MDSHPLREYRKGRGLTQEALGKELGVTAQTVWRWETGSRRIDSELLASISEKTGISKAKLRPDLAALLRPEPEQAAS
jgi:transcriptional regulator with XRE-family HTH domain